MCSLEDNDNHALLMIGGRRQTMKWEIMHDVLSRLWNREKIIAHKSRVVAKNSDALRHT